MKIISKYRDFYDYLSGIWGEDPKIILDRREFVNHEFYSIPTKIILFICGKRIEGFYDGENFYFGESLSKFGIIREKRKYPFWLYNRYHSDVEPSRYVSFKHKSNLTATVDYIINVDITNDLENHNIKENCPILINTGYKNDEKYPILSKMNVGSILPPEVIYQMLVDWLSERNSESENRADNRTDIEKLTSKGFDKKCSFRPKSKICE